jgi:chaperone BCS1
MTKVSRALKAVTQYANVHQLSEDEAVDCEESDPDEDVLDERGIFNFEKWASTIPPRYEPNYGSDRFQHKGYTFWFIRLRKDNKRSLWRHGHDESLSIRCIGRSTKPIKDLLKYIKTWTLSKENKMTSVYRPSVREDDHQGGWERQACRLSRPISTVSLDRAQKANVVRDINEYLHPATARWYATHGIPYRRGYLFHGPPGTGKTSLSFSLAGIFGINIYVVSLSETGLTEGHLGKLFSMLPKRCIVLLEDIDSAGLRRDGEQEAEFCTDTDTDSDDDISKISKSSPPYPPDDLHRIATFSEAIETTTNPLSRQAFPQGLGKAKEQQYNE